MSSGALVEALPDAKQWREMFVGIIGSCTTVKMLKNQNLLQMKAEIQLISPLVPARFLKFIRFTKCHADGAWVVVDFSVDHDLMEGFEARRMPSGCILRDMQNGFSKVTWIEHTEYSEYFVPNEYRRLVRCGMGFGAQRWLSALFRHSEYLQTTISPILNRILYHKSRRCLKDLAKSMTSIFCYGVCLTDIQQWDVVFEAPGRPRVMARKCISSLGRPLGLTMSAAYSVRIPAKHRQLFHLLLRLDSRGIWDPICHSLAERIVVSYPFNQNEESSNCVSVLKSNHEMTTGENQIMVLQDSVSDTTVSLIVSATVDSKTISMVLNEDIIPYVPFLPIGLSIVPYYGEGREPNVECGSMVTVGSQMLIPGQTEITTEHIITMRQLLSLTIQ
ncbi:homeobox-leucine zipper protein HDG1-like [Bidens hawaiensis]|uniref:homeobox-leucine zipper protein HDG1-like n=1 Tax=Bidens hawaiensis TaxID=980011 RepID=UPI0040497602